MILTHNGKTPQIHDTAYVAPTATICGDVTVGEHCRIMHGASIIAESGSITFGRYCIVLENAVVRSSEKHKASIGNHCLIGPNAHVAGCSIEDRVFIATGAAIFHSAFIGKDSEVRVNSTVHVKSHLPDNTTVPIGWVAVGNPAKMFPPEKEREIWKIQKPLNFPLEVYGFARLEATMDKVTKAVAEKLSSHKDDKVVE